MFSGRLSNGHRRVEDERLSTSQLVIIMSSDIRSFINWRWVSFPFLPSPTMLVTLMTHPFPGHFRPSIKFLFVGGHRHCGSSPAPSCTVLASSLRSRMPILVSQTNCTKPMLKFGDKITRNREAVAVAQGDVLRRITKFRVADYTAWVAFRT